MKASIYIIALLSTFSCHCAGREEIVYPKGDIKEIRIYGSYKPKDPQRLENRINLLIERERIKNKREFREKYPEFVGIGDESFTREPDMFCYDRTPPKQKYPPFEKKNLKVRLYDEEENIIAEDDLRIKKYNEIDRSFSIRSYLPYLKNGHFIQIVRLEGSKEVILYTPRLRGSAIVSKEDLIHFSKPLWHGFDNKYAYRPETRCYRSTFKIR